jgi:hypothetical protein
MFDVLKVSIFGDAENAADHFSARGPGSVRQIRELGSIEYLPKGRARNCKREYEQRDSIRAHLDEQLEKRVLDKTWLPGLKAPSLPERAASRFARPSMNGRRFPLRLMHRGG